MKYALLLLLVVGCDPGPVVPCDYCHVLRAGGHRYTCDKCKETHAACEVDRAVMHYTEERDFRGHASFSATSLLVCPPLEAATKVEMIAPPASSRPLSTGDSIFLIVMITLLSGCCYGRGRWDGKKKWARGKDIV